MVIEHKETDVVDVDPRFCAKHFDICLVPIASNPTYMRHTIDAISEFNDSDTIIGILVVCELGMLNWLTEGIYFVDFFLAIGAADGNSCKPTCGIDLVYTDVGKKATRSG